MEEKIICLKGLWLKGNTFISERDGCLDVIPMSYILDKYYKSLPLYCWVMIDSSSSVIMEVVEDYIENFEGVE